MCSSLTRVRSILRPGKTGQAAPVPSQLQVLPGICQPAKSQCPVSVLVPIVILDGRGRFCWAWRGSGHKARQDERPQRRYKEKKIFRRRALTPCGAQTGWGLARQWKSLGQGHSGEDSLKLETEINSSSLSVWRQHLVGAEEDSWLSSAPAAAWKAAGPRAQLGLTQKGGAPHYFLWPLDLWWQ